MTGDNAPLERALASLEGLSVGDAFGECFFTDPNSVEEMLVSRMPAPPVWRYTDDTQMALSVVSILRQCGGIEQNLLAASFAQHYEYARGYGPSMHRLLAAIQDGVAWQEATSAQFGGQGSFGNGAAMRSAPIGAYFADDLAQVIEQSARAAVVTHTHPEAVAGAIAVAVSAAIAWRMRADKQMLNEAEFLQMVARHVPDSQTRARVLRASGMRNASVEFAASVLGNGTQLSAQDTVPFALWCASKHLQSYEDALWLAVSGLGDRDTICAIVGGIVVVSAGRPSIPEAWKAAREPLPNWI